jgi:hypothetical protein
MRAGRRFDYRAFWSVLLAVAAPGLGWTGLSLHAAGHGGWSEGTHAWMAAHWVLAVLFLAGASGHLFLNGRALLRHVARRTANLRAPSREALTALAITTALLLLAVGHTWLDR